MFTARRFEEETGLYHYRRRAYDPGSGRFLQRDPIGSVDGPNIYEYVRSRPTFLMDPLGLFGWDWSGAARGAGVGAWLGGAIAGPDGVLPGALLGGLLGGLGLWPPQQAPAPPPAPAPVPPEENDSKESDSAQGRSREPTPVPDEPRGGTTTEEPPPEDTTLHEETIDKMMERLRKQALRRALEILESESVREWAKNGGSTQDYYPYYPVDLHRAGEVVDEEQKLRDRLRQSGSRRLVEFGGIDISGLAGAIAGAPLHCR